MRQYIYEEIEGGTVITDHDGNPKRVKACRRRVETISEFIIRMWRNLLILL